MKLAARRQEIEAVYEERIKPSTTARRKLPVARFKAQVKDATAADLDELEAKIEEIAPEAVAA